MDKARKWLCGSLVVFTILINFKHVWDVLTLSPEMRQKIEISFFSETVLVTILIAGILASCGYLFRKTFQPSCVLQAICVLAVAGLQLRAGHVSAALLEVPFVLASGLMFYLGYPFPHTKKL
jgi:uncharacterized membrane protein